MLDENEAEEFTDNVRMRMASRFLISGSTYRCAMTRLMHPFVHGP